MEIFHNEYFSLFSDNDELYICVYLTGYQIREFNSLLMDMPFLQLNSFTNLKNALDEASGLRVRIGQIKPRVEVEISDDEMEASIILNISAKEFAENKVPISSEIIEALNNAEVVFGHDNIFKKPITVQKKIKAAKGTKPEDGKDSLNGITLELKADDSMDAKRLVVHSAADDAGALGVYHVDAPGACQPLEQRIRAQGHRPRAQPGDLRHHRIFGGIHMEAVIVVFPGDPGEEVL